MHNYSCISIYLTDDDILNILVGLADHSAAKSTRPDEECGIPSFVPLSPPLLPDSLVPEEASGPTSAEFGTFEIPDRMDEDSIEDGLPGPVIADDQPLPVRYEVVESSTQRGNKKLVDSSGHSYTVKRRYSDDHAFWRCSVRNKMTSCLATVRQRGMVFTPGPHMHCHQPIVGVDTAAKITRDIKEKAMNEKNVN